MVQDLSLWCDWRQKTHAFSGSEHFFKHHTQLLQSACIFSPLATLINTALCGLYLPKNKIIVTIVKTRKQSQETQPNFLGICRACLHYIGVHLLTNIVTPPDSVNYPLPNMWAVYAHGSIDWG